ncbi:MAG: hypothetical protein EOM20_03115 [Spartobacteria bacterium]|nr:hypothetical protein [Spartobacteria bacterium]
MIRGALHHLPGLGPKRLNEAQRLGVATWEDLVAQMNRLGLGATGQQKIQAAITACDAAIEADDIAYLTRMYHAKDHWRILGHYLERASFFDIETSGLGPGSYITLIACLHRGHLHTFVHGENLDAFLDILDEVELLVSFNGASFDVPQVLSHFHIPGIPCPHIDLRWACYHEQLRGGLKHIETELGIERPPDLVGVDGEEAVWLWDYWRQDGNQSARSKLIRYCCADVLSLNLLAAKLLHARGCQPLCRPASALWSMIPEDAYGEDPAPPPARPVYPNTDRQWQRLRAHQQRFRNSSFRR